MIRPFQPADAPAVLALVRELVPLRVESEASILKLAHDARCWVADEDGGVVGYGRVSGRRLWIGVLPSARGRGVGAGLWGRVEEHAEEPATTWTDSDPGIAFAQARGFSPSGRTIVSVLDVAEARTEVSPPEGVRLVSWAELDADPSALEGSHRADAPNLRPEGSFVALVDGRPVSYTLLTADERGVGESEFTATLEEFRGRGLATLCKRASAAWARENGVHTIATGNADTNEPMLAVNRKVGFRPDHVRTELARR
jgi:GNAT superfamily N-acetyltransferase